MIGFALGKSTGAVKRAVVPAVATIVPSTEFPSAIPFTSQTIDAPIARQNEAANALEFPSEVFAVDGEMEFNAEHVMVAVALPDLEPSAMLVAVTVTV